MIKAMMTKCYTHHDDNFMIVKLQNSRELHARPMLTCRLNSQILTEEENFL